MEEAVMDDKQAILMQHLTLISNVFETAVQYMQSLQVSYLAAKRVFDMSHALLACHPSTNANYTDNDFLSYYEQVILSAFRILYIFIFWSYDNQRWSLGITSTKKEKKIIFYFNF